MRERWKQLLLFNFLSFSWCLFFNSLVICNVTAANFLLFKVVGFTDTRIYTQKALKSRFTSPRVFTSLTPIVYHLHEITQAQSSTVENEKKE